MSPSDAVIAATAELQRVVDAHGRQLVVRRLNALDKLRLFKAAGPSLAQNDPWLGMALLAYSVVAIDDVPVPVPATEPQIEAIVARLGDAGIAAIAGALRAAPSPTSSSVVASAGN